MSVHSLADTNAAFSIAGRTAVITGGGRGAGAAIARMLAASGASVLVAARTESEVARVAAELCAAGATASAATCDVSDPRSVQDLAALARKTYGRVDILINNAAMTVKGGGERSDEYFAKFEDYPQALWDRALQVNLTGTFLCCQAAGQIGRAHV